MNIGIFGVKRGLPNSFCPLTVHTYIVLQCSTGRDSIREG
jgi:hypothetical protein